MKTCPTRWGNRDGGAMLVVLTLTMVVSGLLLLMEKNAMQRAFMANRLTAHIRASAIAETGATEAYAALASNFGLASNDTAFPAVEYDGGTYDVTVLLVDEVNASITSVGDFNGILETVTLDVRKEDSSLFAPEDAYTYAVFADGAMAWTGVADVSGGAPVHANGQFTQSGSGDLNTDVSSSVGVHLNGNSGEINGDVTAPTVSGNTGKVTGTITEEAVPTIGMPEIDLAPYYNEALANGEVYDGDQTISSSFSPSGGVMWVNGDLHLSGSGTFTGCFIATGDLMMSGSPDHTKVDEYPGFMSRDGDIKVTGSGSYEGLLYARIGDVEITGAGSVAGSVMAGGTFKKTSILTSINYVESVPVAPHEVVMDGVLCVSAWQQ